MIFTPTQTALQLLHHAEYAATVGWCDAQASGKQMLKTYAFLKQSAQTGCTERAMIPADFDQNQ